MYSSLHLLRLLLIALISLILFGCAKMPKKEEFNYHEGTCLTTPKSNQALIYFFRESQFTGSAMSYYIHDGNKVIGGIRSGTFFPYHIEPGKHTFWGETEDKAFITIDIDAKNTYYISCGVEVGVWAGRPSLTEVVEAVALPIIGELECATLKKQPTQTP